MTLQLELIATPETPLEVEGVTPCVTADLSLAEIERLDIYHGNRKIPLADFFRVSGDPGDGCIEWRGELSGVHWVGAKMQRGGMRVCGDVGRHLGSEMAGGEILVEGNASDWVGGEMHGGRIEVRGNAGHLIGAAYRGSPRGMTGGEILIHGSAGNEVGHTMRRGLIAIGGDIGDLAAFNMLAGSVLLFGNCGIRHGAGMRRGTLGFFGDEAPPLLLTFRRACRYRPGVIELLFRKLARQNFPLPERLWQCEFDLYHGDMIEGGRGEVLVRAID